MPSRPAQVPSSQAVEELSTLSASAKLRINDSEGAGGPRGLSQMVLVLWSVPFDSPQPFLTVAAATWFSLVA